MSILVLLVVQSTPSSFKRESKQQQRARCSLHWPSHTARNFENRVASSQTSRCGHDIALLSALRRCKSALLSAKSCNFFAAKSCDFFELCFWHLHYSQR
jgi:hypothetical protein